MPSTSITEITDIDVRDHMFDIHFHPKDPDLMENM